MKNPNCLRINDNSTDELKVSKILKLKYYEISDIAILRATFKRDISL